MLEISSADQTKAAEALAFSRFRAEQFSRSLSTLPPESVVDLADTLKQSSVTQAGRLAKTVGVKALQLLRARPATRLLKNYKGQTGIKALVQRAKDAPGRTALQFGKGVALPGAAAYGAGRMLSQ